MEIPWKATITEHSLTKTPDKGLMTWSDTTKQHCPEDKKKKKKILNPWKQLEQAYEEEL